MNINQLTEKQMIACTGGSCGSDRFMARLGCMVARFKTWAEQSPGGDSFCGRDSRSCGQMP
jgi:hypothetical protein